MNPKPRSENREPGTRKARCFSTVWISDFRARQRESGIALVIVLGVLTVILIIAVAFALSARTEAKSGASFSTLVAGKSYAKMGIDRCIMEISPGYMGSSGLSGGNTTIYPTNYLTRIDNYTNDATQTPNPGFDYVNLSGQANRDSSTDPYWIGVTNAQGQLIGRFAYTAAGSTGGSGDSNSVYKVDVNGVGNIFGANDTYVRGTNGYIGIATNTVVLNYTHGNAGDINLSAFYRMLGMTSAEADNAAWRTLAFRYGWPGGAANPTANTYYPGNNSGANIDDNKDGINNNPSEYDENGAPNGSDDQVIKTLSQLQSTTVPGLGITNSALTNFDTYGTFSSKDPIDSTLLNLNSTKSGSASDVGNVLTNVLMKALPTNDYNQLCQWAVNIVDFHTTDIYPTVYTGGTNGTTTFIGIKRTPYFKELRNGAVTTLPVTGTNCQVSLSGNFAASFWNPYTVNFASACTLKVTNIISYGSSPPISQLTPVTNVVTYALPANTPAAGAYGFVSAPGTTVLSPLFPTNALPATITVSNTMSFVFYGASPTNLIQRGIGVLAPTNFVATTTFNQTFFFNGETDDPRINYLYPQPKDMAVGGAGYYAIQTSNQFTYVDQGGPNGQIGLPLTTNREGIASFYVKMTNFTSIAETGYVYRGEPLRGSNAVGAWQTLRLQPGGEGRILDFIRVSDLADVSGRINLNGSTNGPLGTYYSPAFFALLSGISNTAFTAAGDVNGAMGDTHVLNIVQGIADYRAGLTTSNNVITNISQICSLTNLITSDGTANAGQIIAATSDSAREQIIRDIVNLITVKGPSGQDLRAWGQTIKGNKVTSTIQIHAQYSVGNNKRIQITTFEYIK